LHYFSNFSLIPHNFDAISLFIIFRIFHYFSIFHSASKITLIKSPKIDKYLIPPTFTFALYQEYFRDDPLPIECEFFKSLKPHHINHVDEYLALRNIILVSRRPNLNTLLDKIPVRFQPKFITIFKFFLINGIIDIDLLEKKSKKILSFYPPPKKSVFFFEFFCDLIFFIITINIEFCEKLLYIYLIFFIIFLIKDCDNRCEFTRNDVCKIVDKARFSHLNFR